MSNKHHYTGLNDLQVVESRKLYGENILTPPEKESLWDILKDVLKHWISISMAVLTIAAVIFAIVNGGFYIIPSVLAVSYLLILVVGFFGGFDDPLFKILITAFVLSMGISIYEFEIQNAGISTFLEPIGIIVALLLATGVAYFLERKNEKTFQSLNDVNDDTPVKVIRNNNISQIPRREVVVGDIVLLDQGEEIPADCQLLESYNLIVNESSLTGELQANKTTDPEKFDKNATYPSNQIMKGTTIIEGNCTAEVFKVGDKTESGKVFESAQVDEGDPTPLSEKLDALADKITKASYIFAALIIVGRLITYFFIGNNDFNWLDFSSYLLNTVMIAVTLIVVAVPEGLPMSVTLSLAFSMKKLMNENTLPRTMHACETMGAASVICTDKTGTLTQNKMQVADTQLSDIQNDLLAEMIAVNTTANLDFADPNNIKAIGNPTEGALLLWLNGKKINYLNIRENVDILNRLPFSTENKYMATVVKSNVLGKKMLYVKGAPEILLELSQISADEKQKFYNKLSDFQGKAFRTLALAYSETENEVDIFEGGKLNAKNLKFVGIFAIADPVRPEVAASVKHCIEAGIQVKIVTGDTPLTAKEIGRQIGLLDGQNDEVGSVLTGADFAAMTDQELLPKIHDLKILSRAKPHDKERLVKLLKQEDYVVAATGDGTNDAPALNAADVGLSMGDGTAVAKEASDMTIQDNSFSTISNAVMWGRSLYKNIQRFIMFQMTINVCACLIVLIGAFIGTQSPLTVTQMLWVNLIMDTFAAIALASLPPQKSVMQEKPRRVTDFIINGPMMKNIFGLGGFFTVLLLLILVIMQHSDIKSMTDLLLFQFSEYNGLSPYELSLFFTIFVMLQFWNMFNAKAFMTGKSAFDDLKNCTGFLLIAAVIFVGQILIVELGGAMFSVCPLTIIDWVSIILLTMPVLIVGEVKRKLKG